MREPSDGRTWVDAYYAWLPKTVEFSTVFPQARQAEIEGCAHERVRMEKYCVWRLLERAVERSLSLPFESLRFEKKENGQWVCDKCCFSLSHSHGIVAVALSNDPVGVDVERVEARPLRSLGNRVFTAEEMQRFELSSDEEKTEFFIECWTKKESAFKREGGRIFHPEKAKCENVQSRRLERDGQGYYLSVAGNACAQINIFEVEW